MNISKPLLIIILSATVFLAYSQDTLPKTDSVSFTKSSLRTTQKPDKVDPNYGYEQLYQNQKEINDKLLSLLVTSLTLIVGIIVAIIGTSIFYNYRFNKKEYELLTKENKNSLGEIHASLLIETTKSIDKMLDKLSLENDKKFQQINETYKSNYDTIRDSLKTIIQHFKDDYDGRIAELGKKTEELQKQNEAITENLKSDLRLNEKQIRKDLLDVRGEVYKLKEWHSLALGTFVNQALLCIETNNEWELEYVLTDILAAIDKVLEKSDTVTPEGKRNIDTLIAKLPERYKSEKERIQEQYQKIPVKEVSRGGRLFGRGLTSIFGSRR